MTLFKDRSKLVTLQALCAISILFSATQVEAKWGAAPLEEKHRPVRGWIENFPSTVTVVANGSISDAIESCPEDKYCVVEINDKSTGLPLEIFRSKTKLVGAPGMKPLSTTANTTFIYIGSDTKEVVIEGLEIEGHSAGEDEIYGIQVSGENIKKVLIRNNSIHGFDSDSDAHGIAVYGEGQTNAKAIENVIIEGNTVFDMRTGSSESIVINGNVKKWEIIKNDVYSVNNIAIDAIGGEGTSPRLDGQTGRVLPSKLDAARYGFIEDNFVEDMHTIDNPAYDNQESWAAAIYVDGGHHIQIKDNVVVDAAWGYEVGAENCVQTRHIMMIGNSAEGSHYGDLLLGGYADVGYKDDTSINCDTGNTVDENEGHGYVKNITVKNSSLDSTGAVYESIELQNRLTHTIIVEPGVEAVNHLGNGSASGDQNAIRIVE